MSKSHRATQTSAGVGAPNIRNVRSRQSRGLHGARAGGEEGICVVSEYDKDYKVGYFAHENSRIDPLLIETVIMEDRGSIYKKRDKLGQFLSKLTNGKPVEYYAQHIKNLAIFGTFSQNEAINRILAICADVENLVLQTTAEGFDLLENPHAGRKLRRLNIQLKSFFQPGSTPNFYHPCFANLTHLHLWDGDKDWPTYAGWENLVSLTHLAFYLAEPEQTMQLIQRLPTVQYVAIGHYDDSQMYRYAYATVNNHPYIRARWGARLVFLSGIPMNDWERGARGEGDFWDLVEREAKRRLKGESVD
jgi:hypothetical protein